MSVLRLLIVLILPLTVFTARMQAAPLSEAEAALNLGDYETAIARYTDAANDPAQRCPALYGLGLAQARADQYVAAEVAFTQHINECQPSFRSLVLRGEMREQLGMFGEAEADYQQAIALQPGLLDSYLYERLAALDPDQSSYFLRLAVDSSRHAESKFALREKLAQLYRLVGSLPAALEQVKLILSEIDAYLATLATVEGAEFDRSGGLRARLEATAADLEFQLGQDVAAYARLQRIITLYPETDAALPALVDLVTAGQPVDLLLRMRINVRNENYRPVVSVLTSYLTDPATAGSAPPELYLLLGRAQRGQGDAPSAIATFTAVTQQFPDAPEAATAALEIGATYASSGDYGQAVPAYVAVASRYPQSPEAPLALLRAAEIEEQFGELARGLQLFTQLADSYPSSEEARQGLLEAGLRLRVSAPLQAAAFFGRVGNAEGYAWQGKLLAQAGDSAGAQAAWTLATRAEPGTFFAMRSCELLNNVQPFLPSGTLTLNPITDAERQAAADWVAASFNLPGTTTGLSPELAADPHLARGIELWAVGMWREARAEFDALHKLSRSSPAALLGLAFYYEQQGINRSSIFSATRLVFASGQPFSRIPRAVLALAYPYHYSDLVAASATPLGLDPLLIAALIRQESSYDPTNRSIADARGLMQLLPTTAVEVAGRLGTTPPTPDDLYRPLVNVPLGVNYLNNMIVFQDGSIAGVLVSYNAGPGAARSWVQAAGDDIELLHETITFSESRSYLSLIYQNYAVYRYLYGGALPGCLFEGAG